MLDRSNADLWPAHGRLKTRGAKGAVILVPQPSDDPKDPLNWSQRKKYFMLSILCYAAFASLSLPSSQQLTYYVQTATYTGRSVIELSYAITVCVVGLVCGPLIFAPLAKIIGRSSLILWSLCGAFLCQVWAALMTGEDDYVPFMLSRFVSGLFASIPTILGPSYAVEIFFLHQRGKVFTSFELSFLLGVNVSPTLSGFVVNTLAWPYGFWWTLAPAGLAIILVALFLEETGGYAQSSRKYPEQPTPWGKNRIATFLPGHKVVPRLSAGEIARDAKKPFTISFAPITVIAGLYIFICFSFVILANILLTIILEAPVEEGGYGFTPMRNALFTLDAWFAILVAQVAGVLMGDRVPLWASRRYGHGVWHPEYRLWNIFLPGLVAPIGLGIFGAAAQFQLHYMVLALGFFLIVFSSMLAVPICLNYVVECYMADATEAAIAMNAWRLSFAIATGFIFGPWMEAVGIAWMFGMAAFFDLGALGLVAILIWKGPFLRAKSPMLSSEEGAKIADTETSSSAGSIDSPAVTQVAVDAESKV